MTSKFLRPLWSRRGSGFRFARSGARCGNEPGVRLTRISPGRATGFCHFGAIIQPTAQKSTVNQGADEEAGRVSASLGRTRSGTRTNDGLPLLCRCPGVSAGDCHGEPARRGSRLLRPRHNTHLLRLTSQFYLREAPNCAVISPASRYRLIRHHCLSPQPQLILSASHSVSRIPAARSKIRHL